MPVFEQDIFLFLSLEAIALGFSPMGMPERAVISIYV